MSRLPINIGTTGNDATGDSIREAFRKTNANFTELYTSLGLGDRQKFTNLADVPNGNDAYNDQAGKILAVNAAEAGLEFLRMEGAGGINVSTTSTPGSIVITNTRSSIITDTTPQLGGDLNAGNKKIYNLGDATEPQDALNLRSGLLKSGYTDAFPDNKMTGPLILNRDPIVSDDRNFNGLIAATKKYVDNSSYVSTVNFYVSTSGTDYRADLPENKRGRFWSYAFRTVQRACEAAEAVINATPLELGPYQKVLTYDGGQSEAAVVSYIDQGGGIYNLSLYTANLRTDYENDLRPGLYLQGDVSKALAKIVSINSGLNGGNEIFVVTPVTGTFQSGEKVRYSDAVQAIQITILVESGIYTENFPIKLPPNTSIVGDEFRRAMIRPRNSISASPWVASVFRRDKTFDGLRLTDYIGSNLASFTTATPSAATGTVTVTLGTTVPANASQWIGGFFRAAQSGSTKFAEGLITAVGASSFTLLVHDDFINLNSIPAGQWTVYQTSTYGRHYLSDITKPIYPVVNYGNHSNAARILTLNKAFIQAEVTSYLDFTFGATSTFSYDQDKCARDVRLILDAVVADMVLGSNYQSVAAGVAYLRSYSSTVTTLQKAQTIAGISKAKQLAIAAVSGNSDAVAALTIGFNNVIRIITNGLSAVPALTYPNPTGLADPNRYAKVLLIANRTFIQKEVSAWLGATYTTANIPNYSAATCERDVGYVVDALVYDLTYGGNSQTVAAALAYVIGSKIGQHSGEAAGILSSIAGEESYTAAAFGRMKSVVQSISRDLAVSKTTTGTNPNTESQVRKAALGITDALTDVSASTSLGLKVDNLIDVVNSIDVTVPYTTAATIPTVVYPTFTTGTAELQAAKNVIDTAQVTISAGVVNYLNTRYSGTFKYNKDKCARDVGIIVDAMAFDLKYSGGQRTIAAALTYYQAGAALVLSDQLYETTSAYQYLHDLAETLITNPLTEIPPYTVVGDHTGYRYQNVVPQAFAVARSSIISFTASTKAITSSNVNVVNFIDLGFLAGDTIIVTGTINNDDSYTIASVTESTITVMETLTNESAGSIFTITNDLTINAGSTDAVTQLTNAVIGIINNDANYNPPLPNDQLDVFLCNDAVMIRNITFQGHGGFTMVFDPEGQIRTKSPYAQTCSSMSRSINSQIFTGGQFVDGFAGNVAAAAIPATSTTATAVFTSTISGTTLTITSLTSGTVTAGMTLSGGSVTAGTYIVSGSGITWTLNKSATGTPTSGVSYTTLGVSGLVRQPQVPCSFVIAGNSYSISTINNYSNVDGSATLNLSAPLPTSIVSVVTAGSFVAGLLYTIKTIADTDYTLVGAASNTVGLTFTATGVGSGSGTVYTAIELITAGNRSMLSNDFTQVNDLGYGLVATNNGLIEAVSVFTYYNYTAYYSLNGGQIRSLNGSCAYGLNALKAEGSDPLEVPDDVTLKYDLVQTAKVYAPVTMTLSTAITGVVTIGTVVTQATSGLTGTIVDVNTARTSISVLPILPRVAGTVIGITGGSNTGTITSSGAGVVNFSTAGFAANQYITIYGTVSNDGSYKISGTPSSTSITLSQKYVNGAWTSTFTTVTETAGTYLTVAATGSFLNTSSDTMTATGWTNTPYPTTTGSDYATATAGLTVYVDSASYLPNNLSEIEITFTGALTRVYRYEVSSSSLVTSTIPSATTAGSFVVGVKYTIVALGSTTNAQWNTTAGTSGITYIAGSTFIAATVGTGTGTATKNDLIANNATAVYKLNLSAGAVSVGSTGLYTAIPHGQYITIRQNRTLWLDGLKEVVAVRPSTALVIADQPTSVYRVLSFTLVNSQTGTFVWSGTTATIASTAHGIPNGTTILVSFSGGTYGNPATAAYVTTYISANAFSINIGSANGTGYDSLGAVAYSQSTGQGYANLREPYGQIIINDYAVTGGVAYPASHGGIGDTKIACIGLSLNDIPRIVGMKFGWYNTVHTVTGYLPPGLVGGTTDSGTLSYGRLTFTPALTAPFQKVLGNYDSINSFRAVQVAGQTGNISVNISTMRATGHDMLSIGTGSYADSNYPNNIYGPPITSAASSKEVQEIGKGRVFYVSTDQDGNFKVGEFFKVDQGTGTVTFSASIALSNLNGLGFKRGVAISEFSTDDTMTDNAADTVPTEQAVRGYIEKRLGITHTGGLTPSSTLIPNGGGFVDRKGLLSMTGSLKMGNNTVTELGNPSSGGDAVPYSWLTFGRLQDFDDHNIQSGDLLVMTGNGTHVTNAKANGPVTFSLTEGDSSTPIIRTAIGTGQITNEMFSSNSLDKLSLSKVQSIAKADVTSTFSDDTKKGLASFNSTQFSSADGFISFTGTVALSSIGTIAAYTLLGNNSPTTSAPSAVAFTDVVTVGGALRKDAFTATGVMVVTSATAGAQAFASSLQYTSDNTGDTLVKRDSSGNFIANTITLGTTGAGGLKLSDGGSIGVNANVANVATSQRITADAGQHILSAYDGNSAIQMQAGPGYNKTLYNAGSHDFRDKAGSGAGTITLGAGGNITLGAASTITIGSGSTLTTGAETTLGNITGRWSLTGASRLEATYADLAEYYSADKEYPVGWVMMFGGSAEVTAANINGTTKVAGVVSTDPAYIMNSALEGTRVCLALQGRVPCRVVGKVKKGDLIIASDIVGVAMSAGETARAGTIIGKALEDYDSDHIGLIEVAVGRV